MATEITSIAVQFPWAALITAIAGLSGALGGAFLANKFAENRWYKQVSFEKEKERIAMLREKGEELHILVSKWGKATINYQLYQLRVIKGVLTEDQLHSLAAELSIGGDVHDRMDALLYLYFPSLDKFMKEVREHLSEGHKIYHAVINGALDRDKGLAIFDKEATNVEAAIEKIKMGIRNVLQNFN
ncbi:hypothetical protein ACQYBH_003209 [Salmonella enterica]|uniref:Uncharacterized protein n=1 Tax=Salmonella enterica subsp. enterica serovar Duisburg TaxID=174641 RepID=A0A6W0M2K3_SALET|nr:hypothetical protein [Salmonella enterica]EAA2221691.1 hypothetical protein [Salmonella enterica subsp. enterica serovar Neukoelln]EAB9373578.1 hypothetical protein [Salmonella enterica subsp. enterica serovar Llandoff]EAC0951860.1 hypothetical protein [Salmonella enterica subsp. enterica]EBS3045138.1 hypothetical protein [Salmonella enterica subsp. enterica serovar Tchad]EBX9172134.1 hypothetical protein [Salmonella enterica subsp. enterica serovar Kandla]EBY1764955.1 hypothetical protein